MQYRSTRPPDFALRICASILHTNPGSWLITITYMYTNIIIIHPLDINECDPSIALCEHLCTNSNGSYTCDCEPGYSITTDQLSCLGNDTTAYIIIVLLIPISCMTPFLPFFVHWHI